VRGVGCSEIYRLNVEHWSIINKDSTLNGEPNRR
jgi:hypothetical protein